jgi:hypothetical protein
MGVVFLRMLLVDLKNGDSGDMSKMAMGGYILSIVSYHLFYYHNYTFVHAFNIFNIKSTISILPITSSIY